MAFSASHQHRHRQCRFPQALSRGFTLIELLVALSVTAILAALSWQGLDGMSRAQAQTRRYTDSVLTLRGGLSQWTSDLDAIAPLLAMPVVATPLASPSVNQRPPVPLAWDGRALRITRQPAGGGSDGLRVVAWSSRPVDGSTQWLRWESPPLRTRGEWQDAWDEAAQWAKNPGANALRREVIILPVLEWRFFFYRNDAWTHPLSSDTLPAASAGSSPVPGSAAIPEGVRLVLHLAPGQAISGTVTRDWVRPTLSGSRA